MGSFLAKCLLAIGCLALLASGLNAQSRDAPPDPRNLPPVVVYPDIAKMQLIQTTSTDELAALLTAQKRCAAAVS